MMRHEPVVEVLEEIAVAAPERRRERVVVRRRRAKRRHRPPGPTGAVSRRGAGRIFLVCTGVLLLMAVAVYFSLVRRDTDRVRRAGPTAAGAAPAAEPL